MKRIAYLTAAYPKISETFIQREINDLRNNGFEIKIFSLKKPDYSKQGTKRATLIHQTIYAKPFNYFKIILSLFFYSFTKTKKIFFCLHLILKQFKFLTFLNVLRLFSHLFASVLFIPILKREQISHVHAHFSTATTIALFCNIIGNINFSFTAHASGDIYTFPIMLLEKMEKAKFVNAISCYNKNYLNLISDYKYEDKINIIFNGVEIKIDFKGKSFNKHSIELLTIGNFTYFKGYPTIILAMRILKEAGYNFRLTIIGDGKQREFINNFIIKNKLGDYIKLLGYVENEG